MFPNSWDFHRLHHSLKFLPTSTSFKLKVSHLLSLQSEIKDATFQIVSCSLLSFVCFPCGHVFGSAKENTGRLLRQEILPHLLLVQNINMKKWAAWGRSYGPPDAAGLFPWVTFHPPLPSVFTFRFSSSKCKSSLTINNPHKH